MLSGKLYGNYFTETVIAFKTVKTSFDHFCSRVNVLLFLFQKAGNIAMEGSVRT